MQIPMTSEGSEELGTSSEQGDAGLPEEGETGEDHEPVDLSEETGGGLGPADLPEHTSDALYIVRESNEIADLARELEKHGIDLKKEAG